MNKHIADGQSMDTGWLMRTIDQVVTRQRPLVVKHLRELRRKHPTMSPEVMIARIEKQYLAAVSTSGAAVGATAVAPGIGTATSIGLSVVETAAFLEASAFYAQALTEIHGLHVQDPERSKALVMSLMLGPEGSALVRRVAAQSLGKNALNDNFWGQLITTKLPSGFIANRVMDSLKRAFFRRIAAKAGTSMVGRAIPFGIGAAIGGVGNHLYGRQIVKNAREAFGPAPQWFTTELDPEPKLQKPRKLRGNSRFTESFDQARRALTKPAFRGYTPETQDRQPRSPETDAPEPDDGASR